MADDDEPGALARLDRYGFDEPPRARITVYPQQPELNVVRPPSPPSPEFMDALEAAANRDRGDRLMPSPSVPGMGMGDLARMGDVAATRFAPSAYSLARGEPPPPIANLPEYGKVPSTDDPRLAGMTGEAGELGQFLLPMGGAAKATAAAVPFLGLMARRAQLLRKAATPGELAAQDVLPMAAPERITGAAYRIGDRNFAAPVHSMAAEDAMNALGVKREMDLIDRQPGANLSEKLAAHHDAQGFVTSSGRFLTRDEAQRFAADTGQIRADAQGRISGLNAEDISGQAGDAARAENRRIVARMGGLVEPPVPQGIRAYHSSPHDFERFDISKVGTGQGAQSYGHGIYVAENPAVSGQGGEYWREFLRRFPDPELHAAQRLRASNFDRDRAIESARRGLRDAEFKEARSKEWNEFVQKYPGLEPEVAKLEAAQRAQRSPYSEATKIRQAIDLLESGKPVGPRTYEVNINARPEQFLDWDKPLAQQPQTVKDALASQIDQLRKRRDTQLMPSYMQRMETGELPGEAVYRGLGSGAEGATRNAVEAGIPGIKYLDQGSRGAENWVLRHPQGGTFEYPTEQAAKQFLARNPEYALEDPKRTSNYVLFDDKLIDILRKYGIAGLPAGGAAAGMSTLANQGEYRQ